MAKSDNFDMSDHDFTIFAWFKTGNNGTLFSKAPATGGWSRRRQEAFYPQWQAGV